MRKVAPVIIGGDRRSIKKSTNFRWVKSVLNASYVFIFLKKMVEATGIEPATS